MKIRELFEQEQDYCISYKANGKEFFIEGLDDNGCALAGEQFQIDKIKNILVEIIEHSEAVDTLDCTNITIDSDINELYWIVCDVIDENDYLFESEE
jgi:hypothetical protein